MASSHKLKHPNGDQYLSSQEKSIQVKITQQVGIESPSNIENINYTSKSETPVVFVEPRVSLSPPNIPLTYHQINVNAKFDFDDILIIPKLQTTIASRYGEINPFYENNTLPIMTAPMDSVIDYKNIKDFQKNKINIVLPRTTNEFSEDSDMFISFGLKDDVSLINKNIKFVLLDIANGHMASVINWCLKLKRINPKIKIMAGNIANPATYKIYCDSGAIDYARVGIGNGNGCLTTQQTGVGYPIGSLISECFAIKKTHLNKVKIVADGGMKKYSDIIKALAIGADYVMIGSILAKSIESSGKKYWNGIPISDSVAKYMFSKNFNIKKEFRGMSSKGAQKAMGNNYMKTSEGITTIYKVEYTLDQWISNFEHYLRSAMSYNNSNRITNFIGQTDYTVITNNAFNRFNK